MMRGGLWGFGLLLALLAPAAHGHGVVGDRFFPATLAVDDPFVNDELSLPTIASLRHAASGESPRGRDTDFDFDYVKRITPNFALMTGTAFRMTQPYGQRLRTGFGNLGVGGKYQFLADPERELIASAALSFDLGGTGTRRAEANRFSTATPALFIGKGFGDLPESLPWLRPFAITGAVGYSVPMRGTTTNASLDADTGLLAIQRERNPDVVHYGLTLQYSLPYLQANVRDLGLGPVLGRMVPLVEVAIDTPVRRGPGGNTTGTVNPGVIWVGNAIQLSLEAILPINRASGTGVGVLGQVHFYLDDLLPRSLGRPIFGS